MHNRAAMRTTLHSMNRNDQEPERNRQTPSEKQPKNRKAEAASHDQKLARSRTFD